jgi:enoyl-CoA hydratase/carnithine racemase
MSKTMITLERDGEMAILTMSRGVTNALNFDFIEDIKTALLEVRNDESIGGLLLESSNDKFFCIGFDIPQLISLPRGEFVNFYRSFNSTSMELFTLPKPTMAVITGHAIAGGCVLSLACDYRYLAEGHKLMGLNEIKLGVPVPFLADRILRDLVGLRYSKEIMETGEFYPPEQSLQMGMVDNVLPLEEVRSAAREKIGVFSQMPSEAFAMIKASRIGGIVDEVTKLNEDKVEAFTDRWYADDTRRLLQKAVAKF